MSIWGDATEVGQPKERLLVDPYATPDQFTPKFAEPRDVWSSDTTVTTGRDVNKSLPPPQNLNKLPSHIQLNVDQCRQSAAYAGFAGGSLALSAAAALTLSGRLPVRSAHRRTYTLQVSKWRVFVVGLTAYFGVSMFSFASCLRARNVPEQINAWQAQLGQDGQDPAPQVQRGQNQASPAQALPDYDIGVSPTTDSQPTTKFTTYEALRERNRAHTNRT